MKDNGNVKQWGEQKEILVFLHYFGGAALSWQWVTELLSDFFRCIAIDLPGFGNAAPLEHPSIEGFAAFVQQELQKLDVETYTLIGHSMGGKIAMQLAATPPAQSVNTLILIAPSPPTVENMPAEEKERMLNHPNKQEAEKTVKKVTKKSLTDKQYKLAIETQLIIDHSTWRWWLLEGMNHSIADQVKKIETPITILASEDDPAITYDEIQNEVVANLKGARLVTTKAVGHLIPMESPEWLADQIRQAAVRKAD